MRFSNILISTKKITIKPDEILSQEYLVKAGFIRQLSSGIFTALHFGQRSFQKIEGIIREELDAINGTEISMPVVHPAEIWKKTGRYDEIDDSLVRFSDRAGRDMVLAMTHEEVVALLAKSEITTYKQLPKLVYQIQTKFRDEARSRGGLIRVREFIMKDSYSLDSSWEGLEKQYNAHYNTYFRIFLRSGLPVISVKSDVGMMGGKVAHEFMYVSDIGEDTLFICKSTGYQANKEVATFKKPEVAKEDPRAINEVHTPATATIDDLAKLLNISSERCGKIVFFSGLINGEEKLVVAVVRGDMEVNTAKLQNITKSKYLIPATIEEIEGVGSKAGFASPIGIDRDKAVVVVDDLIPSSNNLVLGANKVDYHLENVCYGRDYEADFVADIVSAYEGAMAPNAQSDTDILTAVRGVEAGNIFQLGTKYTNGLDAMFTNDKGKTEPIIMGSYGIGVGRLLGCLAEEYHDDRGLKLPISIAPYQVTLLQLGDKEEIKEKAEALYKELTSRGMEVLFDDRHGKVASAGEKFGDADLVGIPIRLTVSNRSLANGGVEMKIRGEEDSEVLPLEGVTVATIAKVAEMKAAIESQVEGKFWAP